MSASLVSLEAIDSFGGVAFGSSMYREGMFWEMRVCLLLCLRLGLHLGGCFASFSFWGDGFTVIVNAVTHFRSMFW